MIFERVNFNEEVIRKMNRDEFVSRHLSLFWSDRAEATRKKMLTEVYGMINKPAKKNDNTTEN